MNRLILAVLVAALNAVALTAAAPSAFAANTCVGPGSGCFSTLQAAIDAAHDGDTIHIAAGTFAGGVTITKSVRLGGAGAGSTIIRGGGSVLTIGASGSGDRRFESFLASHPYRRSRSRVPPPHTWWFRVGQCRAGSNKEP